MGFMKPKDWERYRDVINEWQEDTFQQEIIWEKKIVRKSFHGEGDNIRREDIKLKGLCKYNHFRDWPITKIKTSGEVDYESLVAYFNVKYLKDKGYIKNEQFKYNPGYDRFVINGIRYKPFGDSNTGQASNNPLFFFIILKKVSLVTGEKER